MSKSEERNLNIKDLQGNRYQVTISSEDDLVGVRKAVSTLWPEKAGFRFAVGARIVSNEQEKSTIVRSIKGTLVLHPPLQETASSTKTTSSRPPPESDEEVMVLEADSSSETVEKTTQSAKDRIVAAIQARKKKQRKSTPKSMGARKQQRQRDRARLERNRQGQRSKQLPSTLKLPLCKGA